MTGLVFADTYVVIYMYIRVYYIVFIALIFIYTAIMKANCISAYYFRFMYTNAITICMVHVELVEIRRKLKND